jgi:hypothetical protein
MWKSIKRYLFRHVSPPPRRFVPNGSFRCLLQISRRNILERLVRAKQRLAVCVLETALVSADGGGEVLLVGGGVAVPRSFDIFPLALCGAEEVFDGLRFCHCGGFGVLWP